MVTAMRYQSLVSIRQYIRDLKSPFISMRCMYHNLLAVIIIAAAMLIVGIRLRQGKPLK